MPIYEFECPKCKKRVTKMQKYTDPAPTCDEDQEQTVKQLSTGSFEFKGSGFYQTDYKGK